MAKTRKARRRKASPKGRQPTASASVTKSGSNTDFHSQHPSHLSPSSHPSLSTQSDPTSTSQQPQPPPEQPRQQKRIRKTREDFLDWLEDAIYTPPGEITKDSAFVQEFTQETTTGKDGSETTHLHVKVVNRLTAARLLCQVNGWINSRARTSEPKDEQKNRNLDLLEDFRVDPEDCEYDYEAEMAAERAYDESRIARGLPPKHAEPSEDAQNQGEVASSNHDSGEDCEHCEEEDEAASECESDEDFQAEAKFQGQAAAAATAVAVTEANPKAKAKAMPKADSTRAPNAESKANSEAKSRAEAETVPSPPSASASEIASESESESESEPEYDSSGCRVDKDGKVWVTMQSIREIAWASKRERERRRRRQSQGHKYQITHRREFSHSGFK